MKRILCKKSQQLLFKEILAFILSHFTLQNCRKYYFKKKRGYQAQQRNDEKYFPFYAVTGSFFSWAPISDSILISQGNCIQSLALLSALSRSGSNFALSDRTISSLWQKTNKKINEASQDGHRQFNDRQHSAHVMCPPSLVCGQVFSSLFPRKLN